MRVYNVWRVCLYVCVQTGVLRGPDLQQGLYMRSLGELHDASFILTTRLVLNDAQSGQLTHRLLCKKGQMRT